MAPIPTAAEAVPLLTNSEFVAVFTLMIKVGVPVVAAVVVMVTLLRLARG